jgi:hypothetical protein
MGVKHKKTRREKIIADYRHQVYILKNKDIPFEGQIHTATIAVDEDPYLNTHVIKDILKTGILTLTVIAMQIVLFFLLQKHIITLPIVKY